MPVIKANDMRYTSLPRLEESLLRTGNNGEYNLRKLSLPVPHDAVKLEGWLCTPKARAGYYYNVVHPKQRIVLHYTAGSLRSDLETLTTTNRHVSVPFVIARDGTIYQLFSSKFWSGHLGKGLGNSNTGNAQDKCTIAIELSNYGWLAERAGNLETCYSRLKNNNGVAGSADVYCTLEETEAYQKLNTPFRSQSYFATFSDAQYQSLIVLLRYLTATYNIPRQFLPEAIRYQTTNEVLHFRGIVSHVNYRTDGKWDLGPAFDWNKVIAGVQAAEFKPAVSRSTVPLVRAATAPAITSEEEAEALLPPAEDAAREDEPYEDHAHAGEEEADMGVLKSSIGLRKKKLYALLVGVDDYKEKIVLHEQVVFPKLSACVPDMKRMKTYLENDSAFDADIKLVTNSQATKAEITRLFKEHLGQAKKGDTALFFFSGHGTQEWGDPALWKEDTDGKLECLVCYYNNASEEKLLADKELRYLLHDVAQTGAHVVALFDCCHSGDNTRAVVRETFSDVKVKAIEYVFPERHWDDFIFSNAIEQADLKEKGEAALLPEGTHVQFSACESDESALEVSGSGVFTKALLKVLQASGGDVSYASLNGRIRQYLKNVYEQKPRVYVAGGNSDLLNENFLNRPYPGQKRTLGELMYNDERGWKFTLGAIHGITPETTSITIVDPETANTYEGTVGEIEIDSCYIATNAKLKKTKTYNGVVEGLLASSVKVYFHNTEGALKEMQELLDVVLKEGNRHLLAEEDEAAADYVVRTLNGRFYITKPHDPFRPLAAPQAIKNKSAAATIAKHLSHISRWTFLKDVQNYTATTVLPDNLLQIDLTTGNDSSSLLDETGTAAITYNKLGGVWESKIHVKLSNNSRVNLYCSALYLTSAFGADAEFLNPPVYLLEPGNSVNLAYQKHPVLTLELNDVAKFYNWKEEIEYLKFIISTDPFDVQALLLESLPKPPLPVVENAKPRDHSITRGIAKRTLAGWRTQTVTLRLQNPLYNSLSDAEKQAMLANTETKNFAQGLYSDAKRASILDKKFGAPAIPKRDGTGAGMEPQERYRGITIDMSRVEYETPPPPPPAMPSFANGDTEVHTAEAAPPIAAPDLKTKSTKAAAKKAAAKKTRAKPAAKATSPHKGQLEYDIPGQMQTGRSYTCRVAIAGTEVDAALMKLSEGSVHAHIRIAEEMSVQLIDCSGGAHFTIVSLSTERQAIDTGELTKWAFEVAPKQSGIHCLVLKITLHQNGRSKDLDVLEKEIAVAASDVDAPPIQNTITRILFIAANPTDTRPVRLGAESREIKEEIGQAKNRDTFLFTTNFGVTAQTLLRSILQEDPTIVHFSGHGNEEGLCLETEGGRTQVVDAAALDALFKNFADTIQCVVLNACYSKPQAEAIAKHIAFVIGMNQAVKDEVALAFSIAFYQALVDGNSIEKSYNLGLAGMAMAAPGDEPVAVLLKRETIEP